MIYSILKDASHSNQPKQFQSHLDIFKYHFPENPLLPGALSGVMLADACSKNSDWHLNKIKGLRFRKPLTPELNFTIDIDTKNETEIEKTCAAKIMSGSDIIADGEFSFSKNSLNQRSDFLNRAPTFVKDLEQIQNYLPHAEPIVLIDQLISADYPSDVSEMIANNKIEEIDQSKLVGTKIHTRSVLNKGNFWLDKNILPSVVLCELVAQAGALTLAPFFKGKKPQVSLLGCDTEFLAQVCEGATIDTHLVLTRSKKLGNVGNMIVFKCECFNNDHKIADITLNAMAMM